MAYYNVLFDRGADAPLAAMGIGADYVKERQLTLFTAEVHVCYVQELHLEHKVRVSLQVLDYDEKRLRTYQEIRHVDGWLAATSETLSLHVDMSGPKVAPFPADVYSKIEAIGVAHASLTMPERAGRSIGIRRKTA
jgi:acyl-CoA thioester hydrolase